MPIAPNIFLLREQGPITQVLNVQWSCKGSMLNLDVPISQSGEQNGLFSRPYSTNIGATSGTLDTLNRIQIIIATGKITMTDPAGYEEHLIHGLTEKETEPMELKKPVVNYENERLEKVHFRDSSQGLQYTSLESLRGRVFQDLL